MIFTGGRFKARLAETTEDVRACQQLRHLTFIEIRGLGGAGEGLDHDEFDPLCQHMMVEDTRSGQLVCCFRLMPLNSGQEIRQSYSAKYYDLNALADYPGKLMEMGRFCIHPAWKDPAIKEATLFFKLNESVCHPTPSRRMLSAFVLIVFVGCFQHVRGQNNGRAARGGDQLG